MLDASSITKSSSQDPLFYSLLEDGQKRESRPNTPVNAQVDPAADPLADPFDHPDFAGPAAPLLRANDGLDQVHAPMSINMVADQVKNRRTRNAVYMGRLFTRGFSGSITFSDGTKISHLACALIALGVLLQIVVFSHAISKGPSEGHTRLLFRLTYIDGNEVPLSLAGCILLLAGLAKTLYDQNRSHEPNWRLL
jgi:hypothetical protein